MLIAPQVPDQTSYAGVTYFDLALGSNVLITPISIDRSGNPINASTVPTAAYMGGTGVGSAPAGAFATAPANVRPNTALRTANAGAAPLFLGVQGNGGITHPPQFALILLSPSSKQTINGPIGGVAVNLSGKVMLDLGDDLDTLNYSLDGGAAVTIDTALIGDFTLSFSASVQIAASGEHRLVVSCKSVNGKQRNAQITFTVNLSGGNNQPNPPTMAVTTPVEGTVVGAEPGSPGATPFALVPFQGTAAPSQGATIVSVTIVIDGDPSTLVTATPKAAGDWSQWSADQQLKGLQPHQALVTCTDSLGGVVIESINVTLALFEPRLCLYSKLMIVEFMRLTSFLGDYGSGRVVRTLSLLPGETTTISVSSYSTDTTTTTETTSIFDSVDDSSTQEFNQSVADEQTDQTSSKDSLNWQVGATANASWGWGSASVSGGVQSSASSARDDASKILTNSAEKHAASRSAKRNIQVNAETEHQATTGEDQSVTRTLKNINVSRTLNFVFRQMNQKYLTVQHLVDVRLGYVAAFLRLSDGQPYWLYQEVTIPKMYDLVTSVVQPQFVEDVYQTIKSILEAIPDYQGITHSVIETVQPRDASGNPSGPSYIRFNRSLSQTWSDNVSTTPQVPGIVINGTTVILRTDGVMVDSQLGQNNALDDYSVGLQTETIREKKISNDAAQQVIDLVNTPVPAKTDAWQKTHPCCQPSTLSIAAVPPATAGAGVGACNPPAVDGAPGGA
jgi:hypothetical protein